MSINLEVPYRSQTNNKFSPYSACNVTCIAMCLLYNGIIGNSNESQLEDEIYLRAESKGLNRFSPEGIKEIIESYGIIDDISLSGKVDDIYKSLDKRRPVIIHGYFTGSGHIIVIKGYDDNGNFIVNDPYGEVFAGTSWWYDVNDFDNNLKGKNLTYSKYLIGSACGSWSLGETEIWYQTITEKEIKEINNLWIHRII